MSTPWTKKIFFFFFGAATLLALGCTPNFASASEVSDLRVLAVQAEPPEAQFDTQGNVQDVKLRILAVDPRRQGPSSLNASLCAPTDSRRCESGPRFDLPPQTRSGGTEFAAQVPGRLMAPVIAYAQSSDKLKGLDGIRVMFAFAVDDGDPGGPVAADKILLYSAAGKPPNRNPELSGISVTLEGAPVGTVAAGAALSLRPGVQYGIRPNLAAGAREEYDTTDLLGRTVHLTEQPRYSFFVTPGAEVDRDNADEPADGVAPPDGLVRINAQRAGQGTFFIVVRDGRGGESWLAVPWSTL